MTISGPACFQNEIRLPDHFARITNQFDVSKAQILRQLHCMDQGLPFGVAIRPIAEVIKDMDNAAHHHRNLDAPRIGAATAVEEHFCTARFHSQHSENSLGRAPPILARLEMLGKANSPTGPAVAGITKMKA